MEHSVRIELVTVANGIGEQYANQGFREGSSLKREEKRIRE